MPAVPQEETTDEIPDNETSDNDFTFTANSSHIQSTQVPPTPFSSKSLEYSDILRQQNTHHPGQITSTPGKKYLTLRNKSAADKAE